MLTVLAALVLACPAVRTQGAGCQPGWLPPFREQGLARRSGSRHRTASRSSSSHETFGSMSSTYDDQNIFAKILRREVPADIVHEDERCLVFRDITPQAPHHLLIIPKAPIAKLADAEPEQKALLGHLLWVAGEVARREGFADRGFRTVINNGEGAGQAVFHLHVHVLAGRPLEWPPG
jgi:histidine triad (HIT) family protein